MKFWTASAIASLTALAGCGNNHGFTLVHPMGNYSNASLKGSYVYQVRGTSLVTLLPYRETGVFSADGAGHITAGVDDLEGNSASGSSTTLSGAFSGSYVVNSDGSGSIFLGPTMLGNISGAGGSQVGFAITLVSSSKVQLMEADAFAMGAGSAELQDSAAIASAPSGTFVFRVHQEITASAGQVPASQVGAINVASASGTGALDQELAGALASSTVTWTFGAPDQFGTGTATMTDSGSGNSTPFLYYIVNRGKFDLLTSNPSAVGGGSAEAQSGAVSGGLSGSYAFGSRGDDANYNTSGLWGTVATVGMFTASGGSITGTEDSSQDGNLSASAAFPGTCASTGSAAGLNGRVVVTNGTGTPCSGNITEIFWMVSPARAFFLNESTGTFDDGTADLQTTSSFSNATMKGQYALVMDGWDFTGPQLQAFIGPLQFDGSSKLTFNGLANLEAAGGGAASQGGMGGPYSVASNGRITGTVSNGGGGFDMVMYAISGSQAYLLESDSQVVTSGTVELQQ